MQAIEEALDAQRRAHQGAVAAFDAKVAERDTAVSCLKSTFGVAA